VSIEELKDAIKRIQKVPDDSLVNRISEVLAKMDIDKDGAIRLDDVLKVSISRSSRKHGCRDITTVDNGSLLLHINNNSIIVSSLL
jgi:hypothetical protein